MKHKHLSITTILIIAYISAFGQIIIPKERGTHHEPVYSKYYFAIKMSTTIQSQPIQYMIYTLYYDSTKHYQNISKGNFIAQLTGSQKSKANPGKKNLLAEYDIDPNVFEYLWKVRYPEYPFGEKPETGWANGTIIPSEGQMGILKKFGVNHPADVIWGDNLFELLSSICDPAWVNTYKIK